MRRYGRFPRAPPAASELRPSNATQVRQVVVQGPGARRHDAPGSEFRVRRATCNPFPPGSPAVLGAAPRGSGAGGGAAWPARCRFGGLILGTDGSEYRCPDIENRGHCGRSRAWLLNLHDSKIYPQGLAGAASEATPGHLDDVLTTTARI